MDTVAVNNDTKDNFSRFNLIVGVTGLVQLPVIFIILGLMIFVYKTYKTTFQRLILYYVVLGLWYEFTRALTIMLVYFGEERWVCIVEQFLNFSSLVAYYIYIVAITNLWLLLIPCLIMRGRPVSKRISKWAECICVALTATVALTVASVVQAEDGKSDRGIGLVFTHCQNPKPSTSIRLSSIIIISVCFVMDLEVVTASLLLCFAFCFIRWRMRIRTQTTVLLKNSICHVGINAIVMGLDFLGTGVDIYSVSVHKVSNSRGYVEMTGVLNTLFALAIGVSIVVQAVLCIQTSTERDTCCKRCCHVSKESSHYVAIDGMDTSTAATNPASSRVSQPSYTNFDVPYTEGFNTQASASNEQRPLVRLSRLVN